MIYRYIYKITCTAGSFKDKFYFGQHTTTNLDDGYKGGGRKIGAYYKTYKNDYIKEIIAFYNTADELNQAEYDIIHPWLGNEMCLNISEGGYLGTHPQSKETKNKISIANKGKKRTPEVCKKYSDIARIREKNPMYGKHHTEESKQLISEHKKGQNCWCKGIKDIHKGEKNPMYGKHHTEESKQLMSEHKKGQIRTESTNKKQSDSLKKYYQTHEVWNKGKAASEETKQKCREATSRKRWLIKDNEKPIYVDIDKIDYYLILGYRRGRK